MKIDISRFLLQLLVHIAVLCKYHKIPGIIFSSYLGKADSCDTLAQVRDLSFSWKLPDHSITLNYKIFVHKGKTTNAYIYSLFRFGFTLLSMDNKDKDLSRS